MSSHMKCTKCDVSHSKNRAPFMDGKPAAFKFPDMMKNYSYSLDGETIYSTIAICQHCAEKAFFYDADPPAIWYSERTGYYRWIFPTDEDEARNSGFLPVS